MTLNLSYLDSVAIARAVRNQQYTSTQVIEATLDRITRDNGTINSLTHILGDRALAQAQWLDRQMADSYYPGALAGVPFAVKNLFDIAGITTLAGSKINRTHPPAAEDATAITRLKRAGAILVGTTNMDEYAYGFVTENTHYGPTHNPHDLTRIAGGSSGGSAAAVAAGCVPFSLGSDTNGSIRVPAALCGVYGLKPTYGRLSRAGAALFSTSLDHIGFFARSVRDIATLFDVLQGEDPRDPVCSSLPPEPSLPQLHQRLGNLRVAIATDYFTEGGTADTQAAVEEIARVLGVTNRVSLPETERARQAAYLITASEGANLHWHKLRTCPQDFDPATRDRFFAGAMIPSQWYLQAQRFRRWYRDRIRQVFRNVDIILAPTTPWSATPIGQTHIEIDGKAIEIRSHLGHYTQPLSFIGLPVLSIPVCRPHSLPVGVQLIAAPYNEALIFRVAATLEAQGAIACSPVSIAAN